MIFKDAIFLCQICLEPLMRAIGLLPISLLIFCVCTITAELQWPLHRIENRAVNAEDNKTSNLHGQSVTGYYVSIQIGTPAQPFKIVVDTGSSNLAVAGSAVFSAHYYDKDASSTADLTNSYPVETVYTEGSWKGTLLYDVVSIKSAQLVSPVKMPVTQITSAKHFFINNSDWQGILGLGYSSLVQPMKKNIPSVMKSIISKSNLENIFSLQLCSHSDDDLTSGSLIIGGSDSSLSVGKMLWTNIKREWYYEVTISSILVGNTTLDLPCSTFNQDKTIVDSGTTNLRFPTVVYKQLVETIKQYVKHDFDDEFYNATNVYCSSVAHSLDKWFPPITINLPSASETKTISLIVYPSSYIQNVGKDGSGKTCYQFSIYPSTTGSVLGTTVMEQYYVVFDRENKKIGFAKSSCTWVNDNLTVIRLIDEWTDPSTCHNSATQSYLWMIVLSLLLFVVLIIAAIGLTWLVRKYHKKSWCCCKEQTRYAELNDL